MPQLPVSGVLMRRSCRGFVKGEGGNALIEMAVSLPVFFMFAFGLINFALVMFGVCNITYASRYATRYACLHSTTSYVPATNQTISSMVPQYVFRYPSNTYSTTVSYSGAGGTGNVVGNTVTVQINVTYNISLPFYSYNGLNISSIASGTIIQ